MKKIFSIMAACALAMGFTACESIPSPYEIFDELVDGMANDIYYESTACYTGWNLEVGKDQTIQYNPWSQGSNYTQATGYQKWDGADAKSNKEAEGFLVSPKFKTLAKNNDVVFSFDYCIGYANNDKDFAKHTKVYVSKTYEGGAIDLTQWEQINWTPTHTSTDWTLANTGNIALPEDYMNQDNVHIAFWFYAPASGSATFEIKNFVIETGEAGVQPEQPGVDTPDGNVLPYESASCNEGWASAKGAAENPWSQGASYAQATGYQKWGGDAKTNKEVDGYLFSPAINTTAASGEVKVAFDYCVGYANNDPDFAKHIKVYASSTASGNAFNAAEWKELNWTATHTSTDWTLKTTEIQLPAEFVNKETVRVAFWFYAPADKSSTFEIKNFKMLEGKASAEPSTPDTPTPGGEAKGSGTAADPFNVAAILAFGKEGNYSNSNPSKEVYVKGIVSNVAKFDDRYGQINYYISEDGKTGGEEFYVYGGLGVDGAKFTSAADLKVGANVVVCGKVTVYNGTVEFNYGSKIVSITNNEGGGNTGGTDDTPAISGSADNGDFESWSGGLPVNWKSTTTAGNVSVKQSTDAHGGKYAVECANASANKRLAYKELTLEAGEYTMTFWTKAAGSATSVVRPGYAIVVDGKIGGGDDYKYGDLVNDIAGQWQQVTHTFKLEAKTTINVVIMIPKNAAGPVLIDDFLLMKGDTKIISSRRRASK